MPRGLLEALKSTVKGWTRCLGSSPGSQLGKALSLLTLSFLIYKTVHITQGH